MLETLSFPPAELRFRRRVRVREALGELWQARELVRTLVERDLRARYRRAFLGFAWPIITPVVFMVVFTVFFQRVAKVDTRGAPYPLFAYIGFTAWSFFSRSVSAGSSSLLGNSLLKKVYCPREIFPLASIITVGVDTAAALGALALLFVVTDFTPRITALWVPVLVIVQLAFVLGVTMTLAAVSVYVRDLTHTLPMLLQLGLFVTPVAYGFDVVPGSLHWLYALLNPLAPVIDGYRRTVLYGLAPNWELLLLSSITATLALVLGYTVFKRLETGLADVA